MTPDVGLSSFQAMSRLDYQRTVIGYHGCDQKVVDGVLHGRLHLARSTNQYDWLGEGIYFWEFGPERAWHWATEISKRRPDRIRNPAVLGAVIHLGVCFDLLDVRFTDYLADVYPTFRRVLQLHGKARPRNEGLPGAPKEWVLRKRDCSVLNWAIPQLEEARGLQFDTVRGAYQEGEPAFPGSGIRRRSHIQIAVRRPESVLGYFLPALDGRGEVGSFDS